MPDFTETAWLACEKKREGRCEGYSRHIKPALLETSSFNTYFNERNERSRSCFFTLTEENSACISSQQKKPVLTSQNVNLYLFIHASARLPLPPLLQKCIAIDAERRLRYIIKPTKEVMKNIRDGTLSLVGTPTNPAITKAAVKQQCVNKEQMGSKCSNNVSISSERHERQTRCFLVQSKNVYSHEGAVESRTNKNPSRREQDAAAALAPGVFLPGCHQSLLGITHDLIPGA